MSILVIFLASTLVLTGCGRSGGRKPTDLVAPTVTATQPTDSAKNVVLNSGFNATFSELMDVNSLTATAVTLRDPNNQYVAGNISLTEQTLTFQPGQALSANTTYTARINRFAKDQAGNKLANEFTWNFTTGTLTDSTAPKVTSTSPEDFAQSVALDATISVAFDEPIDPVTLSNNGLIVKDTAGNAVAGTLAYQAGSATFTPSRKLEPATTYVITATTAIKDMARNALAANFSSRFTTRLPDDIIPPQISSTSPADGEKDIATNQALLATFSEALDPSTVTATSFVVLDPAAAAVAGTVTSSGTTAKFKPTASLKTNTRYTVTLTTAIADSAKNTMSAAFTYAFTTGDGVDRTPPSVAYVSPFVNEKDVSNNNAVSITFSEAVDPATISGNTFTLSAEGKAVTASVVYGGNTAILRPARNLADNTVYTAAVTAGIKDLAGNALAQSYSWSFTSGIAPDTETPTVSSTYPGDTSTGAGTNGAILATFSEAMNAATLTPASITLRDNANNSIAGTIAYSGAAVTFTPIAALTFDTLYTASIDGTVKDLAGNSLASKYSWTFTTGSAQDTTPPRIVNTVPAAATSGAPVNRAITATFTEPVRPDSLIPATFGIRTSNGTAVSGTLGYSGTTATFLPDQPLNYSTSYSVTVSKSVRDLAGNPLGTDLIWIFSTGEAPDLTPPAVTSSTPIEGALTVITSVMNLEFSEPMEVGSINTASLLLRDAAGNLIAGTVHATPTSATFTPRKSLSYDSAYTARLTANATDLARNPLTKDHVWSFTTAPSPDLAPPIVATVNPKNGADRISNGIALTATFSESVSCPSVTGNSFTLTGPSGAVAGSIACSGANVTFTPTNKLATRAIYTATLTHAITDLSGDAMKDDFSWRFTTAPWTQQIGTETADRVYALTTDGQTHIYIAGSTDGSLAATTTGSTDVFLAKIDLDGTRRWVRQVGTTEVDTPNAVAVDSAGNAYITGYTYGTIDGINQGEADLFLIKYDSNGNLAWRAQLGTVANEAAGGVALDSLGNVYVAGYTEGAFPGHTQNGGFDIFIAKFDSDGQVGWLNQFGTVDDDLALALRSDGNDNFYLAGASEGNLSGSGKQGGFDAVLMKINTLGNILWTTQFGTPFEDQALSVALDANSNIYLAGHTLGDFTDPTASANADAFLAKVNSAGTLQWTKPVGGSGSDRAYGVATDSNGGIYLTGFATGAVPGNTAIGGSDLLLGKFSANGDRVWTTQLGTGGDDVAFGVATDRDGNVFIGGSTQGSLDENLNAGSLDGFVIKYNSSGEKQ